LPVISSNHSSSSLGDCLTESLQLQPSSSTHFTDSTGARSVRPNYSLQGMPNKQSQAMLPLSMGLPNQSQTEWVALVQAVVQLQLSVNWWPHLIPILMTRGRSYRQYCEQRE
jgi:hypothetical protein